MSIHNEHTNSDDPEVDSVDHEAEAITPPAAERSTEPVDVEGPPRLPFPVVGIGASAGGLEAVSEFLSAMRVDSGMAFVLVQHLPPDRTSMMAEILSKRTAMPVQQIEDGMAVEINHVYVIRPGHSLTIREGRLHLGEQLSRPANNRPVDEFFKSLAEEQRERAIAIIMSGMGSNGAAGAQAIKVVGGLCIAQEPETAQFPSMPRHLIEAGYADYILPPKDMPEVLLAYSGHPYARGGREEQMMLIKRDQQHLREILAILRTRTRQNFNGYKKPTVFRRVQRRMGLNRITQLGAYAKFLRQTPSEVTALSDDLLIHVTGFFRDPEAWEVLRERVIVPLIGAREQDASVRAWVAGCSSGEEAYTLAMLLVEETERLNKSLDIKIFATDMAERTLQNARHGIYPGGIENDITTARLERFFQKDDAVYRVRQELRERVVFAPQNLLQDPPFSRLDIVSCRNLLIYLEPEMQQRVLSLLHFGLREGGALFLGTSETAGPEELFEPLEKKARVFRRIGPTRHGTIDFPLPHSIVPDSKGDRRGANSRNPGRPSISQMTTRSLLENHTPAAVTIDHDFRITYYHGNTEPFLAAPRGEPTRDLLSLARETLRGAIRTAVHGAMTNNVSTTVLDGWTEIEPGRRVRIAVNASSLDPKNAPEYFVVSFQERGDQLPSQKTDVKNPPPTEGGADELRRVREELQSTIEELQTSNEELKASHEEVVSTNEELQSTNEELETSQEEMQSLNEELSTVNSQLHAKMEEHQAARNDLTSLLTSTDIAVLFLDRRFKIRRFTPQVKDLLDLIGTDVGRPLSDLAKKFLDPDLTADAELVLERLIPIEREVPADQKRWYLRRITPYRTADNRIDGVVVAFVEITARREAEIALRDSEERFRLLVEGASDFAMILLDTAGKITAWNTGAERLLGYSMSEAVGRGIDISFTSEDRAHDVPARMLAMATETGKGIDERWHLRKNGERFWSSGILTAMHYPDGTLRGFVKVMRDETARKQAEEALQISKDAAESANSVKDEFLAMLSHELRTPLSAVLLWSKIMLSVMPESDPNRNGLVAIHTSAEAQKELIEDLLDISRITTGKLRLQIREIELKPVIRDAIDAIGPTAREKGVTVLMDVKQELGILRADPDRLRQIVWNLLTNAVKFTPTGGRVDVRLQRTIDEIEIRVTDTGRGISSDFMPHVFERFRQAETPLTRTEGGVGLGLAIVRQLVELHHGTIEAASDGVNRGATFTVRLPVTAYRRGTQIRRATEPVARLEGIPLTDLHILLVEDDVATRTALAKLLSNEGVEVREAGTVDAALDLFVQKVPDMIISDIGLPGEDGYTLIHRIRTHEKTNGATAVPAIALTAFARDTDKQIAIEAGFQKHIGKPIDANALLDAVRELKALSE